MIGANPLLPTPDGARVPAYWGAGAGMVKIRLGDNEESGGLNRSSLVAHFFLNDATIDAGGRTIISKGTLLVD